MFSFVFQTYNVSRKWKDCCMINTWDKLWIVVLLLWIIFRGLNARKFYSLTFLLQGCNTFCNIKQIFHAFLFNIGNCLPEVTNIQQRVAELNIILPRANNFYIRQKRQRIFILLYTLSIKRKPWVNANKANKFQLQHNFLFFYKNYSTIRYSTATRRNN